MKPIPTKRLLRLVRQVSELMASQPDAEIDFRLKGTFEVDKDGEVGVDGEASGIVPVSGIPVSAELGSDWRSTWDNLGSGEYSLRIHRPAKTPPWFAAPRDTGAA